MDVVVVVHGLCHLAHQKYNSNYGVQAHIQTMECVVLEVLQVLLAPLHQLLLMQIQEIVIHYVQVVHRVVTGIVVKATLTAAVRHTLMDQDLQIYAHKAAFQEFHVV